MSIYDDGNEHIVDRLWDEGADAARSAWGPLGCPTHPPCPYADGTEEHEAWWNGFHQQYWIENRS